MDGKLDQLVVGIHDVLAKIGNNLPPQADWAPTLVMADDDGEITVVQIDGHFMDDAASKTMLVEAVVPNLFRQHRARMAALAATAWMSKVDPSDQKAMQRAKHRAASKDPQRQEILFISGFCETQERFDMATIVRRPNQSPNLTGWETMDSPASGRIGSVLRAKLGQSIRERTRHA